MLNHKIHIYKIKKKVNKIGQELLKTVIKINKTMKHKIFIMKIIIYNKRKKLEIKLKKKIV